MRLSGLQRFVVLLGALALFGMLLYPPWIDGGYGFLFDGLAGRSRTHGHVDATRLLIQCVVVAIGTGLAVVAAAPAGRALVVLFGPKMNWAQWLLLCLGVLAAAGMFLFPPWRLKVTRNEPEKRALPPNYEQLSLSEKMEAIAARPPIVRLELDSHGYCWRFAPPAQVDREGHEWWVMSAEVDGPRLALQLACTAAGTLLALATFRSRGQARARRRPGDGIASPSAPVRRDSDARMG